MKWRKATWALVLFNGLMAWWLIAGLNSVSHNCDKETTYRSACDAGTTIGAGIGVALILGLWFMGFVILGLIWLMSRPHRRHCPRCAREVRKGLVQCPACGYSFGQQPVGLAHP